MGTSSKDLLHLEDKFSSASSPLESALLLRKKDSQCETRMHPPAGKPFTNPVAQSQVLGKVRDFLGVISEANNRLHQDAKDNCQNYDIEALTGNESEVIEMDLMLGIADLHTPEAVAAAESAIASGQPVISVDASSSEIDSEDTSDESDDEDNELNVESNNDEHHNCDSVNRAFLPTERNMPNLGKDNSNKTGNMPNLGVSSLSKTVRKKSSKKRPNIVEMS
ncbi:hypothetical protein K2173_008947 [Erythroxylum novogranatense]|uniref:Uncharacterized protein n=1 Tax=Erythroxylum novogranatense TaxID=1862640 RepID=A0AAV8TUF6_9ROSI|nr:hypothetical protein K2173_008947 [Erythroxylum novogranatense]